MYHFVKFNNSWYLKVESEQDIIDHHNNILSKHFIAGFEDRKKGTKVCKVSWQEEPWVYHAHPETDWNNVVVALGPILGKSWVETAHELENKTLNDRKESFKKGRFVYLTNGLPYCVLPKEEKYEDEIYSDVLKYPSSKYSIKDVRYIVWPSGKHYYAKIDNIDIVDMLGNQKWDTREEAQKAAEWFISKQS